MKIIKASYEIYTKTSGEDILKEIEIAARNCYKSEDKIEYINWLGDIVNTIEDNQSFLCKSARPLVKMLIARKHYAMLEFGGMIHVIFTVDRGVTHELVRHRHTSFAQESTRYCNYTKGKFDNQVTYIIPSWSTLVESEWTLEQIQSSKPISFDHQSLSWLYAMNHAEQSYNKLINDGWTAQQARTVLPNSTKATIHVSCNIVEWRHIFEQRTSKAAHPQMREVMIPLLAEFKERYPIVFDDINNTDDTSPKD